MGTGSSFLKASIFAKEQQNHGSHQVNLGFKINCCIQNVQQTETVAINPNEITTWYISSHTFKTELSESNDHF